MYKCKFCEKEYDNNRSYSFHIKRSEKQNFDSEVELLQYLCNVFYGIDKTEFLLNEYKEEKICTHDISKDYSYIVQLITAIGIKRTNSEEKKTARYKNKYVSTLQDRYGKDILNVSQVDTVRKKIEKTLKNKYGSLNSYYNDQIAAMNRGYENYVSNADNIKERQTKIENTLMDRYGVLNPSQIPEAREKISNARKREISQLTEEEKRLRTQKAREAVKYESSLEIRVKKSLVELEEDFLPHQFLWGYNFDILLRDKILIEVNGDFWHANPSIYEETDILLGDLTAAKIWNKDKRKLDKAKDKGYTVITIWESEIRPKTDIELLDTVRKRIEDVRSSRG